jgi:hypothetical protein
LDGVHTAHALILTALRDECEAIKALAVEEWTRQTFNETEFYWRREVVREGRTIVLALVNVDAQGSAHMAAATVLWAERLGVRHLALSGICAGKRNDTALGDIVVFKTVFDRAGGKRVAGQPITITYDNRPYSPRPGSAIGMALNFAHTWVPHPSIVRRPPTIQKQACWYLTQLRDHGAGGIRATVATCPNQAEVEEWLRKQEVLEDDNSIKIGVEPLRRKIDELSRSASPEGINVLDGVSVCDVYVTCDDAYFRQAASDHSRLIVALEMEASGFLIGAEKVAAETAIVAKGVQDYAGLDKNDAFREYGAKAAGAFCVDFLIHCVEQAPPLVSQPEKIDSSIEETEALRFLNQTVSIHRCSHIVGARSSGKTLFLKYLQKHIKKLDQTAVVIFSNMKALADDDANAETFIHKYIRNLFQAIDGRGPETWASETLQGKVYDAVAHLNSTIKSRNIYIIVDNGDVVRRYDGLLREFYATIASISRDEMYSRIRHIFSFSIDPNEFNLPVEISPFNSPPRLLSSLSELQVRELAKDGAEDMVEIVYALTRGNRALTRLLLNAVNSSGMALSSDVERLPPPVNEYVEQLRKEVCANGDAKQALVDMLSDSTVVLSAPVVRYLLRNGLIRAKARIGEARGEYEIDNPIIEAMVRRLQA